MRQAGKASSEVHRSQVQLTLPAREDRAGIGPEPFRGGALRWFAMPPVSPQCFVLEIGKKRERLYRGHPVDVDCGEPFA